MLRVVYSIDMRNSRIFVDIYNSFVNIWEIERIIRINILLMLINIYYFPVVIEWRFHKVNAYALMD